MGPDEEPGAAKETRGSSPREQVVASLRGRLQRLEGARPPRDARPLSSGCEALDQQLPASGLMRGMLVECLGAGLWAGGAGTLALILARQVAREGGAIVVLDHQRTFYPPAAAVWGVDWEQLVVIRPREERDRIWALDQALRCPAVASVWAPLEQVAEKDFRRLQLAAEQGGTVGLLVRPHAARRQPSWSDLQLWVEPLAVQQGAGPAGRRLRVKVTRCRQGRGGGGVDVEVDEGTGAMRQVSSQHETPALYPVAQLAHSATRRRSARA